MGTTQEMDDRRLQDHLLEVKVGRLWLRADTVLVRGVWEQVQAGWQVCAVRAGAAVAACLYRGQWDGRRGVEQEGGKEADEIVISRSRKVNIQEGG